MSEVKHGRVRVSLPESIALPAKAGKMSKKEVSRLLKAPHGLGEASEKAASALEKVRGGVMVPPEVTPESLRAAGAQSEEMLLVIHDLEVVLSQLKQGKLLLDHQSHLQLIKLKDLVRAQAKHNHEVKLFFADLLSFFNKPATTRKANRAKKARQTLANAPVEASQDTTETSERSLLSLVKLPEVAP